MEIIRICGIEYDAPPLARIATSETVATDTGEACISGAYAGSFRRTAS
jgi:hypothetical protein